MSVRVPDAGHSAVLGELSPNLPLSKPDGPLQGRKRKLAELKDRGSRTIIAQTRLINSEGTKEASPQAGQLLQFDIQDSELELDEAVLIAKINARDGIYVFEKVAQEVYTTFKLCEWISVDHVQALLAGRIEELPIHPLFTSIPSVEAPAPGNNARFQRPRNKKGALARQALLGNKASVENTAPTIVQPGQKVQDTEESIQTTSRSNKSPLQNALANPSRGWGDPKSLVAGETESGTDLASPPLYSEKIRVQYLEALYKSKTSVAFFAKGPLARARASCEFTDSSTENIAESLCSHYRSAILPARKLDVKYSKTIPDLIHASALAKDHEKESKEERVRKIRRTASKIGKNGLYAIERDFIVEWWSALDSEYGVNVNTDHMEFKMKRSLKELQCREVQLQILLVLETILLEQSLEKASIKEEEDEPALDQIYVKPSPNRKKADLQNTLDLLADKLCIWQALGVNIDFGARSPGPLVRDNKANSDELRDFCMEVIKPFYGAKLPEQCKSIGWKFGVSTSMTSKARPPLMKSASATLPRPGSAINPRRLPPKQKSLQRVLSDERDAHRAPSPAHRRSPSIPSLPPSLKRESVEPTSRPSSRAGIQKGIRFDHREVDLDSVAKHQQAKLKKISSLVEQKKELDAAISALRKPNRSLQAKEFAEEVEKRTAVAKDPKKRLLQGEMGRGVQVMATPKKRKATQSQPVPTSNLAAMVEEDDEPEDELSYIETAIPSSTTKPRSTVRDAISNIPFSSQPPPPPVLTRSFTAPGPSLIASTPSTSRLRPDDDDISSQDTIRNMPSLCGWMTKSHRRVEMTPMKKTDVDLDKVFLSAPVLEKVPERGKSRGGGGGGGGGGGAGTERSIYEALGWDDEDEDELI
ncbi:MAG: hypothetical protein Q9227_000819 [Pyrenula ochraceoflavens]